MEIEKEIIKLEEALKGLKEAKREEERLEYERKPHRECEKGDLVYKGKEWGLIGWVENEFCNITKDQGYCSISLMSGFRGCKVTCKVDEWTPLDKSDKDYLIKKFNIMLSGEEIQELLYILRISNSSVMRDNIRKKLKNIGQFSFNKE